MSLAKDRARAAAGGYPGPLTPHRADGDTTGVEGRAIAEQVSTGCADELAGTISGHAFPGHEANFIDPQGIHVIWRCLCGWTHTQIGLDPTDPLRHLADEILADGWRKVGATEWGVRYRVNWDAEDRYRACGSREDADRYADDLRWMYDPGDWVVRPHLVSRTVTETAWTTPEETADGR